MGITKVVIGHQDGILSFRAQGPGDAFEHLVVTHQNIGIVQIQIFQYMLEYPQHGSLTY